MPSNHFDSLLAELDAFAKAPRMSDADQRELIERRLADPKIMKALQDTGKMIREEHEAKTWARNLMARAATRAKTKPAIANNERARLAKAITEGSAMLKSMVAEGRIGAIEAARGEALLHRANERLAALS